MKYYLIIITFVLTSFSSAQSNLSVYVKGGLNYSAMRNTGYESPGNYNSNIDRFYYSVNLGIKYAINENNRLYLNGEITRSKLSHDYGGWGSDHYTFTSYPVTLGYEYIFLTGSEFKLYTGAGMSYIFRESEVLVLDDMPLFRPFSVRDSGFGFEMKIGSEYKLDGNLYLLGEINYRLLNDVEALKLMSGVKVNLSGVSLSVGLLFRI
ncbi:MAG: outer membrane beta-barrel protein [Ignavibacteriales bacterium]|nr:outer membrane beta-barrel protein [Ignavibacteriales bacterium]